MAGLGARLFPAFSKLTSTQVNGYLMDQTIMRFANATARNDAFNGAGEPTLAEGMTCYLDDTNQIQSYTGSAWVTLTSSTYPPALELITTCTVTSSGGTSATASNGVITIGNGNTSVTVSNAFSANYDNYKILLSNGVNNTIANISCVLGATVAGYSSTRIKNQPNSGTPAGNGIDAGGSWGYFGGTSPNFTVVNADLYNPFAARYTVYSGAYMVENGANSEIGTTQGFLSNTTSYTSFTLTGGTFTSGTLCVYGYRKS
jgi:hypothetical protein